MHFRRHLTLTRARPWARLRASWLRLSAGVTVGVGLAGCSGLEPVATFVPTTNRADLYMNLRLNHRAITLSTVASANTLQLTATPLDAAGNPMTGLPAPTFTSLDTTNVWVTPEGELQARGPVSGVLVIASLIAPGNIRHDDTATVNVTTTDPPPALANIVLDPLPPPDDSTTRSMYYDFNPAFTAAWQWQDWIISATPQDAQGAFLPDIVIEYQSLDPTIATVQSTKPLVSAPTVTVLRPGQVRLVAQATAYGTTKADTVEFTVTWPMAQNIFIRADQPLTPLNPPDLRLRPNGVVAWLNQLSEPVDITFDDPTNVGQPPVAICNRIDLLSRIFGPGPHCGAGDIMMIGNVEGAPGQFQFRTIQVRQFPVAGVYNYHSTSGGFSGRIVVTADPDPGALP